VPTLKQLYEQAKDGFDLVVIPPHTRWMEETGGELRYSEAAKQYALDVWAGAFKHERTGRFSPSSIGECQRRLLFQYIGAPQIAYSADDLDLMATGTALHLAWQMEGLSAGYLLEGEVWVHDPELKLGGSMDGLLIDDSIWEIKTQRSQLYAKNVAYNREPDWDHLMQVECYFRLSGRNRASIMYQDRDSGMPHEFRVGPNPRVEDAVDNVLEDVHKALRTNTLPPMLDDCEMRVGTTYKRCPYREHCPKKTYVDEGIV
jgi:hypothetical protein